MGADGAPPSQAARQASRASPGSSRGPPRTALALGSEDPGGARECVGVAQVRSAELQEAPPAPQQRERCVHVLAGQAVEDHLDASAICLGEELLHEAKVARRRDVESGSPSSRRTGHFVGLRSRTPPRQRAAQAGLRPSPCHPYLRGFKTRSPARSPPRSNRAYQAVRNATGTVAPSTKSSVSGSLASVRESAIASPDAPADRSPMTLSPTERCPTNSPTSTTTPAPSWPIGPGSPGYMPSTPSTSRKLSPVASTRTRARCGASGCAAAGLGTNRKLSRLPRVPRARRQGPSGTSSGSASKAASASRGARRIPARPPARAPSRRRAPQAARAPPSGSRSTRAQIAIRVLRPRAPHQAPQRRVGQVGCGVVGAGRDSVAGHPHQHAGRESLVA